jgi:Arc/MetJ-type ribon-helix-helix transcriptional regulator
MGAYPPEIEAYIDAKVRSGEFPSRDDFEVEAIRIYRELEARHEALRADIRAGLVQASQGQSAPLDLDALKHELIEDLDEQGEHSTCARL